MQGFLPIFLILILWLCIGLPLSMIKKQQNANQQKKPPQQQPEKTVHTASPPDWSLPEGTSPAGSEPARRLTPSIAVTEHDDSIYRGSLNAETGEGYDPCHDEQMGSLNLAETAELHPTVGTETARLPFNWTGNDIVRGVVVSEILKRKH